MIRQKVSKPIVALFLLLALLGAAAIGPHVAPAGKTVSPPQHHLLACGNAELPPCQ
ncbi:MAG TPA: hypothetical protein VH540_19160 [Ktedonobacterales bacterium]|jgi:hypothetical protein